MRCHSIHGQQAGALKALLECDEHLAIGATEYVPGMVEACRYRGMCCAGCGERFVRGESVRGGGAGFVHRRERCSTEAWQALRSEAARGGQGAAQAWPPVVSAATADEARACSVWAKLEREYALSDGREAIEVGGLLLPRHDRTTFVDFLRWMMSGDARRARLLSQVTGQDRRARVRR